MAELLFVSKPVGPPWNDSGKNLVRDLARGLRRYRATVMVRSGAKADAGHARELAVYPPDAGGFAPALADQARVFGHLLTSRGFDLWHFFFAPNPKSCWAGQLSTTLRMKPSIHTLSSAPLDARAIAPRLFADLNVVLSRHTELRLAEAGVSADRLLRIAPAIEPLKPLTVMERAAARRLLELPAQAPLVVYPGDLEFGEGGALMIEAQRELAARGAVLVMACRAKTARAREKEKALRERAQSSGLAESVRWLGETPHIHALLASADVVALPSRDLYAKMDYPLVLLEAMSLERPVCVAQDSAAAELTEGGAALALELRPDAVAASIAQLLSDADAARALATCGRNAVLARYSYEHMARAYEEAYDRVA